MLEELAVTELRLQKEERPQRRRGALGPLLCVAALGSWVHSGAAYALEVPHEAALDDAAQRPITLNPPGESLVFGTDEKHCIALAQSTVVGGIELDGEIVNDAAEVPSDAVEPMPGSNGEHEDIPLAASAADPCITLAMPFAAAGPPVLSATNLGFSATLGQIAVLAGLPAAVAAARKGSGGGSSRAAIIQALKGRLGPTVPPGGAPGSGGTGRNAPTPAPEPTSLLLFAAGGALAGRALKRRMGR